jgi:fatty-acyl-CoA synthase
MPNIFEQDLGRNPANYAPLTPLSYLERAAYVYPRQTAIIHGGFRATWAEA